MSYIFFDLEGEIYVKNWHGYRFDNVKKRRLR